MDSPAVTKSSQSTKKRISKKLYFALGLVVFLIIIAGFWIYSHPSSNPMLGGQAPTGMQDQSAQNQSGSSIPSATNLVSSNMLIYGTWIGNNSLIKAADLTTVKETIIATLPINVKKVSVLSPSQLLYIDQTDQQDHGKQLAIYNLKDKQSAIVISASDGFGIDDYVLSPNKQYVTTWEVAFADGSAILQGGRSRVYVTNLSQPRDKHMLYDEVATPTGPVHYPRAVLNNGEVFSDKFLPNDPNGGTGWAYGMSMASFDGKSKQDIPEMQNGTYGTQPALSPDGKYIAFAGYDGSRGSGTNIANGYRQAILTPNTVELLDTNTLQIKKLPNLSNSNTYSHVSWDNQSGELLLSILSHNDAQTGTYTYTVNGNILKQLSLPDTGNGTSSVLSVLSPQTMLVGFPDGYAPSLGNLGESYTSSLREVDLIGGSPSKYMRLNISDAYLQYISVLPENYFQGVLGVQTTAQSVSVTPQPTLSDSETNTGNSMQLFTFFVKTALDPTRLGQQSAATPAAGQGGAPLCNTLTNAQCSAQGLQPGTKEYGRCVNQAVNGGGASGSSGSSGSAVCADSPLYVYGKSGQSLHVSVQTPVSNAIPTYPQEGYDLTTLGNGEIREQNSSYASIAYDYLPNKTVTPPAYGKIVAQKDMAGMIKTYAQRLGLNAKETMDLLLFSKTKVRSPYVFLSFFDQKTSEQILPLSFSPQPDNYSNIVFYFKQLSKKPNFTPPAPEFNAPFSRTGLTVVEISEIVE